jgi:xanthine/CO dehydrogenase XdhC/CoxF family maturation factor
MDLLAKRRALAAPAVLAASAAADTITVQNGQTTQMGKPGQPPQDLIVTAITMYGSGSLQFLCDYTINCTGNLTQQPA